jgi:arsenate reductase (thioredoxin)
VLRADLLLVTTPLRGVTAPPYQVLFLCTANSARSILAEALINDARVGQGRFHGHSAGSHPRGEVQPLALALLADQGFSIAGLRSKSWSEFAGTGAASLDFVITVCDRAAAETCPIWPGQPMTAHWNVPDPAAVDGPVDEQRRAYRDAMRILRRRIELLAALPIEKLTRLALHKRVRAIGRV